MIWNADSKYLLKKLEGIFSTGNMDRIQFHIFADKSKKLRFPGYPWIVVHESLTKERDATRIDLMFYLLQKCSKKNSGGKKRQIQKDRIYLVQAHDGSSDELAALLRSKQDHIEVKILLLNDNEFLIDGSQGNRDLVSADLNEMPDHAHCSRCNSLIGTNAQMGQDYQDANGAGTLRMRNGIGSFALDNRRSTIVANAGVDTDSCPHCQKKPYFSYPRQQQGYRNGLPVRNMSLRGEDLDFDGGYGGGRMGTRRSYPMTSHEQCMCLNNGINGRRNNNYSGHFNGESFEEELLERYDTEGRRGFNDKCQCSDDGSKICFNCLLDKLRMSSSPELRFQRSGSAPALFFTGEFEDRMQSLINRNRNIAEQVIPVKITDNKATSTDDLGYKELVKAVVINKKPEMVDNSTDMDGFIDLAAMLAMLKAESTDRGIQVSPEIVAKVETASNTEPIQIPSEKVDLDVSFAETVLSDYLPEKEENDPAEEEEFYVKKSFKIPDEKLQEYACGFCPNRKYRAKKLLEVHMKNNHKKCNCPCQEYFKTREDYLEHFYYIYPLPCLEDKKCPDRFRSLYYQSIHHRDVHRSGKPFFCIPCSQNEETLTKKTAFKDLSSLRIHATAFDHDTHDMFLISNDDKADDSGIPFSMRCSGINYC